MEIILSSNSSKPIYTQITEQIKAQIMDGTLRAGDPIPSMRSLAKSLPMRNCSVTGSSKRPSGVAVSLPCRIRRFIWRNSSAGQKNI